MIFTFPEKLPEDSDDARGASDRPITGAFRERTVPSSSSVESSALLSSDDESFSGSSSLGGGAGAALRNGFVKMLKRDEKED